MNPAIQKKMEMILKMRGNRKMTLMIFINNNPFSFLLKKKKLFYYHYYYYLKEKSKTLKKL